MPYIDEKRKAELKSLGAFDARSSGELNYLVTELIKEYITIRGLRYATINDVVGALEGAKMEFYRRIAAPYEDLKIQQNGDVYLEETKEVKKLVENYLKSLPEKF